MAWIEAVRQFRLARKSAPTRKLATTPTRFRVKNIPDEPYLLIPEVSSERRAFIPMGFIQPDTMSSNLGKIASGAKSYHFDVFIDFFQKHDSFARNMFLSLFMQLSIIRLCPWFGCVTPQSSLADFYDPLTMPPDLTRAHQALD